MNKDLFERLIAGTVFSEYDGLRVVTSRRDGNRIYVEADFEDDDEHDWLVSYTLEIHDLVVERDPDDLDDDDEDLDSF